MRTTAITTANCASEDNSTRHRIEEAYGGSGAGYSRQDTPERSDPRLHLPTNQHTRQCSNEIPAAESPNHHYLAQVVRSLANYGAE